MGVDRTKAILLQSEGDVDKLGPLLSQFPVTYIEYIESTRSYIVATEDVVALHGALTKANASPWLLDTLLEGDFVIWTYGKLWASEENCGHYFIQPTEEGAALMFSGERDHHNTRQIMRWPSAADLISLVWQCRWKLREAGRA